MDMDIDFVNFIYGHYNNFNQNHFFILEME